MSGGSDDANDLRLGDLAVVFVDLDASGALLDAAEAAVPRLSSADIARAESFASDPDQRRYWRAARIATRIILERAAGSAIRRIDFVIETGGRPSLENGLPFFNVSHSGAAALIAVAKLAPVGVDIERLRSLAMTDERRRRIVTACARLAGEPARDPRDDGEVLKAWVRLEAVAKALGTGIGRLLTEEGIIGNPEFPKDASASPLASVNLDVRHGYVAAVATDAPLPQIDLCVFPSSQHTLSEFLITAPR